MALGLERIESPDHVVRGDRAAVVEARLGPQGEDHERAVLGHLDRLGDEAVFAERLVLARDHEGIEGEAHPARGDALQDEGVEAVVGADRGLVHLPALGGVRIGVVEMGEAGLVLHRAMHGDPGPYEVGIVSRSRGPREKRQQGYDRGSHIGHGDSGHEVKGRAVERTQHGGFHGGQQAKPGPHPHPRAAQPAASETRPSASACARASPAASTRPSEWRPSARPRQSLITPPAPSSTGMRAQ